MNRRVFMGALGIGVISTASGARHVPTKRDEPHINDTGITLGCCFEAMRIMYCRCVDAQKTLSMSNDIRNRARFGDIDSKREYLQRYGSVRLGGSSAEFTIPTLIGELNLNAVTVIPDDWPDWDKPAPCQKVCHIRNLAGMSDLDVVFFKHDETAFFSEERRKVVDSCLPYLQRFLDGGKPFVLMLVGDSCLV